MSGVAEAHNSILSILSPVVLHPCTTHGIYGDNTLCDM